MVINVFYQKKSAPAAGKFVVNFQSTMGGPSGKLINLRTLWSDSRQISLHIEIQCDSSQKFNVLLCEQGSDPFENGLRWDFSRPCVFSLTFSRPCVSSTRFKMDSGGTGARLNGSKSWSDCINVVKCTFSRDFGVPVSAWGYLTVWLQTTRKVLWNVAKTFPTRWIWRFSINVHIFNIFSWHH